MEYEQIDIFGNIRNVEDPAEEDQIPMKVKSCRHTKEFLEKSISFHKFEASKLQDENYKILIEGPGLAGRSGKKHTAQFGLKRILKNEKKIKKHFLIIQCYENELKELTKE